MDWITLLLRIVHIFAGIAWVGSLWMLTFYIGPTAQALGADGGKFMIRLIAVQKFPVYAAVTAVLTILAGWTLWFLRYGFASFQTTAGTVFAIGGILGLIGGGLGGAIGGLSGRIARLGTEMAQQGKPPSPEQLAEMAGMQARLRTLSLAASIVVSLAVLCMATARYL